MAISQRQIVQECFDGRRERDCSYCPAHHSKGGICCFAHRFEYDDDQCLSCSHNDGCEPLTHQLSEQRAGRPRRPQVSRSRRRLPVYGQEDGRANESLLTGPQQPPPEQTIAKKSNAVGSQPEVITYLPLKKEGESKWAHFFKGMGLMGAWGAGEGSLELVLGYMRRRRPE